MKHRVGLKKVLRKKLLKRSYRFKRKFKFIKTFRAFDIALFKNPTLRTRFFFGKVYFRFLLRNKFLKKKKKNFNKKIFYLSRFKKKKKKKRRLKKRRVRRRRKKKLRIKKQLRRQVLSYMYYKNRFYITKTNALLRWFKYTRIRRGRFLTPFLLNYFCIAGFDDKSSVFRNIYRRRFVYPLSRRLYRRRRRPIRHKLFAKAVVRGLVKKQKILFFFLINFFKQKLMKTFFLF